MINILKFKKHKKLNSSGFSHDFVAAASVVVVAIIGVGYMVASHAATNPSGQIVGIAGKCLDNNADAKIALNPIQLNTCDGSNSQVWTYTNAQTIVNSNGYCLNVKDAGTTDFTPVDIYPCNGSVAETWTVDTSNNTIVNPHSGYCLDDHYANTTDLNPVDIYQCNGTNAQVWKVPVAVANPIPTVSISVSPPAINSGSSSILSWTTTNATSCSASGNWSGPKATSGSISTGTLTAAAAYSLNCRGKGGSNSGGTSVTVISSP